MRERFMGEKSSCVGILITSNLSVFDIFQHNCLDYLEKCTEQKREREKENVASALERARESF